MEWLKIKLFRIAMGVFVAVAVLLFIYMLSIVGGSTTCPSGEHEESRYGRFGGSECVRD